jgi:tetratricopeptide (TPR) repeat protein
VVVGDTTVDYSQPIVLASPPVTVVQSSSPPAAAPASANPPAPTDQAMELLDAARSAFAQGDYAGALTKCDQSIARLPNSTVAHEFRGLVLFALQRYKDAAAPVYAVLSVGPGWDWATLSSFYPRPEVYSGQLRALEQYVASNENVADARFLLAYHYMTGGHNDAAAEQFKAAVRLNPQDQLSAQLLSAMTPAAAPAATASSVAAAPAKPIDASALTGVWTSTRADGTTITLSLAPDAKYTWKFARRDKPQEFSGAYAVADNLLILKEGDNPAMVGQVTLLSGNRFNFKLAGDNPGDPGLVFGK